MHAATEQVTASLGQYGYRVECVRLSELMRKVQGGEFLADIEREDQRVLQHMDAGDAIRHQADRNDAVAGLAVVEIADYRAEQCEGNEAVETVFVLDSLKHPAEVASMRRIYGDRFILISVHSPTSARREALTLKVGKSYGRPDQASRFLTVVDKIMGRDEHDDQHGFGQNVRDAFVEGDVYVSTENAAKLADGISRYLDLFFGNPFLTPTRDEYAMFQTHAAALRSADLSRQVGAAICTADGEIVAVGCNEVPKAFGGQYWPGDEPDRRDYELGYDSNVKYRDRALTEAFDQLNADRQMGDGVSVEDFMSSLSGTRLASITEFGRTVHAEMAALLDAARRGASVDGKRLFTTTFPCHNCARHIIGAGIREVVFREPYEKSLAGELHSDAVLVDPKDPDDKKVTFNRFLGVGPPQYLDLFTMTKRKDADGNRVEWESNGVASPDQIHRRVPG